MSCIWQGYYAFDDEQYPITFLEFQIKPNNTIYGKGYDQVGNFQINGNLQGSNVKFIKHYIGQHKIIYEGTFNGHTIEGQWAWQENLHISPFLIRKKASPN